MAGEVCALQGRESEVFRLGAAWGAAARGRPALVLLTGRPGVGRTALAHEAARLAGRTGGTVLWARCHPAERSLPLQPVVEALGQYVAHLPPGVLRQLTGAHAAMLATLVPAVGTLIGAIPSQAGPVEPDSRLRAVTALIESMAAREPVLLVLDDLHHAGLATIELLGRLVDGGTGTRLLVVATADNGLLDGAARLSATRMEVATLPPAAVTRLAESAGRAADAGRLRDRTRGQALFVVEALAALADGAAEVPESLPAAVLARVERTGPQTASVLRAAATLGIEVDPGTLARLVDLPLPLTARHCETALAAGLLTTVGRAYEFTHELIRDALYMSTPLPARTVYHRRAADLLGHRPEALAAHAAAVGDWARAAQAWRLAGQEAIRRGAVADGEALLARAQAVAGPSPAVPGSRATGPVPPPVPSA
jgi:predicted ATPase